MFFFIKDEVNYTINLNKLVVRMYRLLSCYRRWRVPLESGLLGKRDVADRLFGSLQVDISKARDLCWAGSRLFLGMRG